MSPSTAIDAPAEGHPVKAPRFVVLRTLEFVQQKLKRLGLYIDPFLVVREGLVVPSTPIRLDPQFTSGFVGPQDIDELVRAEPGTDAARCAERFERGFLCFAVKHNGRIVSKMWCDLQECHFEPHYRQLREHEAYLFSAYTNPTLRGLGLAPYMRQELYAALRAMGRDEIFSITDYLNGAARAFKLKVGAVDEMLRLHVRLFDRHSHTFTLRRYRLPAATPPRGVV
jgi:hypothetical protein